MKVLIVDDEQIIRQGIKTFIPWEKLGCTLMGEASNGLEALELMEKIHADIIISDIRMPFMDGLDLSRELRLKYPRCKVILLTGHEDFEYARKALQYKVTDYLLKPVGDDELSKVIEKTVQALKAESSLLLKNSQMKNMIRENKKGIQTRFVENLIHGRITENLVIDQIEELQINISEDGIFQIIIIFPDQNISDFNIPEGSFDIPCKIDGLDGRLILYSTDFLDDHFFKDLNKREISAAVGSKVEGIGNITQSFKEAEEACDSRCFLDSPALIYHSNSEMFKNKFLKKLPSPLSYNKIEYMVIDMFHSLRPEMKELPSQLLHSCILDGNSREDYIRYCRRLYNLARKEVERKGITISHDNKDPFSDVKTYDLWKTILDKTEVIFSALENRVLKSADSQYSALTSQTITYIENHFKEDILLSSIAESLGVSESHISRVFKKDTGINFVPWINRFRIEYSLELLADGDLKLYDIADLSGFSDYKYYTRQFKRFMGISPTEFRKNLFSPQK